MTNPLLNLPDPETLLLEDFERQTRAQKGAFVVHVLLYVIGFVTSCWTIVALPFLAMWGVGLAMHYNAVYGSRQNTAARARIAMLAALRELQQAGVDTSVIFQTAQKQKNEQQSDKQRNAKQQSAKQDLARRVRLGDDGELVDSDDRDDDTQNLRRDRIT